MKTFMVIAQRAARSGGCAQMPVNENDAPNFRQSVVDSRPLRRRLAKRIRIQFLIYEKDKTSIA